MGNVVAVQGDSTLKAPELHITYEGKAAVDAADGGGAAATRQRARACRAWSPRTAPSSPSAPTGAWPATRPSSTPRPTRRCSSATCVVNQQKNVLQGKRLFVDRKAGTSRLETPAEGGQPAGRIAATFYQTESKGGAQPKPKPSAADRGGGAVQDGVFGSFKMDPNAPMDIEADTLDVYDTEKQAVFRGNVKSKQGDFVVRTVEMIAFYTGQAGFGLSGGGDEAADKTPSQLTRVEAKQKVLITSKDGQTRHRRLGDLRHQGQHGADGRRRHRLARQGRGPRAAAQDRSHHRHVSLRAGAGARRGASRPADQRFAAAHGPGARRRPTRPNAHCPPGRQCLLVYPKEAQDKAKGAVEKVLPGCSCRQDRRGLAAEHQRQPGAAGRLTPCGCSLSERRSATAEAEARRRPCATATRRGQTRSRDGPMRAYGGPGLAHGRQRAEELSQPHGGQGGEPGDGPGRGRRAAGPQRRRQDHRVLHGHRPGAGRCRPGHPRRPRRDAPADVSARPPRDRLSAAGGLDFPRASRSSRTSWRCWSWWSPTRKRRKEQLDSLLEEFNITRLRKSPSLALSGGERRRCEIARALASRPSFMLLDEPFAGIDPLAVGDIQQLVRQLTARGIGVLITDHNVRETLSLVDRAYIIYDGQVLTHGNPQEIIANEDVRRVYLGDMFG